MQPKASMLSRNLRMWFVWLHAVRLVPAPSDLLHLALQQPRIIWLLPFHWNKRAGSVSSKRNIWDKGMSLHTTKTLWCLGGGEGGSEFKPVSAHRSDGAQRRCSKESLQNTASSPPKGFCSPWAELPADRSPASLIFHWGSPEEPEAVKCSSACLLTLFPDHRMMNSYSKEILVKIYCDIQWRWWGFFPGK